jgi:hypothetical protein
VKRLLIGGAIAGAALLGAIPQANATIVICDNMPVMVGCYWMGGGQRCTVYATRIGCVEDLLGSGGNAVSVAPHL